MNDGIQFGHDALRILHIAFGFLGLIVFWIPVFTKKGSARHIRSGRLFVACAIIVSMTALLSSLWALLDPISLGQLANASEEQRVRITAEMRLLFSVMLMLSLGVLSAIDFGWTAIRSKDIRRLASVRLRALLVAFGAAGIWLLIFGGWNAVDKSNALYGGAAALGALGLYGSYSSLKLLSTPPEEKNWWLFVHIEQMSNAGIGFHTAFVVFGMIRLIPFELPGLVKLALWILPAVIGTWVTSSTIARYRERN